MIFNILSLIGVIYDFFIEDTTLIYLGVIIFFRFYQLEEINYKLKMRMKNYKLISTVYDILVLLLLLYFISHILGCIYIGISVFLIQKEGYNPIDTWMGSNYAYQIYQP
jgi:hypothetical protein